MRRAPGLAAACSGLLATLLLSASPAAQSRGLTHASQLAAVYDAILDAEFQRVPPLLAGVCGKSPGSAPQAVCHVMDVVSRWWQLQGDPLDRRGDAEFERLAGTAIAEAEAWTVAEPMTAQAWFYVGAAYSTRVQWRVLRGQRLAAARDGKRIKDALERALALDPAAGAASAASSLRPAPRRRSSGRGRCRSMRPSGRGRAPATVRGPL